MKQESCLISDLCMCAVPQLVVYVLVCGIAAVLA